MDPSRDLASSLLDKARVRSRAAPRSPQRRTGAPADGPVYSGPGPDDRDPVSAAHAVDELVATQDWEERTRGRGVMANWDRVAAGPDIAARGSRILRRCGTHLCGPIRPPGRPGQTADADGAPTRGRRGRGGCCGGHRGQGSPMRRGIRGVACEGSWTPRHVRLNTSPTTCLRCPLVRALRVNFWYPGGLPPGSTNRSTAFRQRFADPRLPPEGPQTSVL